MSDKIYKRLKKQKGEQFAQTLRNHHNGLLEIKGIEDIVRHAGRDATPLLQYLMSLLTANDNATASPPKPESPFALLKKAGYRAFHADTLEKQNSIQGYFQTSERLCTFNDHARYQNYHIVHAVKENVENIKREDFEGKEKRQDEYSTSVISIQMLKSGGFISIKNRYNHAVESCDNTFKSNPDEIIPGLSSALKNHFNVNFSAAGSLLPEGYVPMGDQIFKFHTEMNNIYYGDQAWVEHNKIQAVNRAKGDALFDRFLFDHKTKTLKPVDPQSGDSFADDFNKAYGGNKDLAVDKNGNLKLNEHILIGTKNSQIKTLNLPALTTMGNDCLLNAPALTQFDAPALTTMGHHCLFNARALTQFKAPALTTMGEYCLCNALALTQFEAPALTTMGNDCLCNAYALTQFKAPALTTMGNDCLYSAPALTQFDASALTTMGNDCLCNATALTQVEVSTSLCLPNYLTRRLSGIKNQTGQTTSPRPTKMEL